MERPVNNNAEEHIIDITRDTVSSTSTMHGDSHNDAISQNDTISHDEERALTVTHAPTSELLSRSTATSTHRFASSSRRGGNYGLHHRSPLNSGLWISIELFVNLSQITAAVIVLSFSRHEHSRAPLFAWVIGYTVGCVATLPHIFWRYIHWMRRASVQDPTNTYHNSSENNALDSNSNTSHSVSETVESENGEDIGRASRRRQNSLHAARRLNLNALVDHFKMALDCFFAVWFIVGNVWIFGGRSSVSDSPNLYRISIVFLTFSCIGYALPFILCAMICCCLPCIMSLMGLREDIVQTRGATAESINSLPTYKFKVKRRYSLDEGEMKCEEVGGILAAGTDKERSISAEDAECCICLAKYADNDYIRELPCNHFFHVECVDKWLKINALCPLCKIEVGHNSSSY